MSLIFHLFLFQAVDQPVNSLSLLFTTHRLSHLVFLWCLISPITSLSSSYASVSSSNYQPILESLYLSFYLYFSRTWPITPAVHSLPPISHSYAQSWHFNNCTVTAWRTYSCSATTHDEVFRTSCQERGPASKSHFGNFFLRPLLVLIVLNCIPRNQALKQRFTCRDLIGEWLQMLHLWGVKE